MKLILVLSAMFISLNNNNQKHLVIGHEEKLGQSQSEFELHELWRHQFIIKQFYADRGSWKTTNMGDILFKNYEPQRFDRLKKNKTLVIFIWNKWSILYTGADLYQSSEELLSTCSVQNCVFTRDRKYQYTADVVLTNIHKGQYPTFDRTNPKQKWVLMTLESPLNLFNGARFPKRQHWRNFVDKFNWVMSYRVDADVPVPYGRVVPLPKPTLVNTKDPNGALAELVPFWELKQTNILIATLMSNCAFNDRKRFMTSFTGYTYLDIYGACAMDRTLKHSCPPSLNADCTVINHYLFYLVLENSSCRQYLTEKLYYHAFLKGAVPVIWGAFLQDCEKLLPPHSFIHVDSYYSYEHLITYLKHLSTHPNELLKYHMWRKHFAIAQDHGFFGTKPMQLCRLCEALNYNVHEPHIYSEYELGSFLNPNKSCVRYIDAYS